MRAFLTEGEEPPPLLHPNMAHHYLVQIEELHTALQEDSEAKRMGAADIIRSLVKEIVLTAAEDGMNIDVRGELAGILAVSQVKVVAGGGFELAIFEIWRTRQDSNL